MATLHSHHPPEDCLNCEHRHLRMFCNLTPEALTDYDQIASWMSHARGPSCFTKAIRRAMCLSSALGQVKISSTSRDGKTMILKNCRPGDVWVERGAANVPHEVTGEAISPAQVKNGRKQELSSFWAGRIASCMRRVAQWRVPTVSTMQAAGALRFGSRTAGAAVLDWATRTANGKPEIRSPWP